MNTKTLLVALVSCLLIFGACGGSGSSVGADGEKLPEGMYGKKIDEANAMPIVSMLNAMKGKDNLKAKVTGEIVDVCQKKGCWMAIKGPGGNDMRVTFKDYGFFVPLDATGKLAVMEGEAKLETTDVATLRHFAEDAGKSKEEIAKITEPEIEVTFVADGVILKDK